MPTTILTALDASETAAAISDLAALPTALDGARLVGSIGPRARNQRTGPNAIGTFRYLLSDGAQTTITHDGDQHLRFVFDEADGPTRRIELEEVLPHKVSRASLGKDATTALRSVAAFVSDLSPDHDPIAMGRIEAGTGSLKVLLRLAMIETIGRRNADQMSLAVAGRKPSMAIWDADSRAVWRFSPAGRSAVDALAGSACVLVRKTKGARDWLFQRRRIQIASNEEMDRLDAMEALRLHLEARSLIAAQPFVQTRLGDGSDA